jgi:hypothetical protein
VKLQILDGDLLDWALETMKNELGNITYHGLVKIVRFRKKPDNHLK